MAVEYYKFIKVSKHGQEYFYNCPNFFNGSSDCFNYFRGDLNRVLLDTIPSQYTIIDCNSVTTSTSTSTTIPITTGTTIPYTTGTSTSTSTTTKPCDIGYESVSFVNNATFPYDYTLQQGYIQVKLKNSSYSRNYQFKVISGANIIKDWTAPVQQMVVAFKLNCANYNILVRDYNDIGCISEITNVAIPCLTTTTSSTTTVSTTTIPTTTTTSTTTISGSLPTTTTTSTTTVPTTTTSTTSTTQFPYAPCAFYYNINDKVYYKDIVSNIETVVVQDTVLGSDISLFNGNIYLPQYSGGELIQRINLATMVKTDINVNIPVGSNIMQFNLNAMTHDSLGNLYLGNGDIYKYIMSGDTITFDSKVVDLYKFYPTQGDIVFIANINAFAMTCINIANNGKSVLLIVKADGSNLILKELSLGTDVQSFAMFVANNTLYCTQYGQEKNYLLRIDLENDTITQDTSIKLLMPANGGTQNPNCIALTYNDQFKFGTMTYVCIDNGVFNLKFDILNGGGQYEYGTDGLGYAPIAGNKFDTNFATTVEMIYIRDIIRNKLYKFRRDSTIKCDSGFTTTTTSTTTVNCIATTGLVLNGSTSVTANSQVTYSVGSYNGSPITSYLWQIDGGTVADGILDTDSVNVTWDGNQTSGIVSVLVGNCAGSKSYFRKINIA